MTGLNPRINLSVTCAIPLFWGCESRLVCTPYHFFSFRPVDSPKRTSSGIVQWQDSSEWPVQDPSNMACKPGAFSLRGELHGLNCFWLRADASPAAVNSTGRPKDETYQTAPSGTRVGFLDKETFAPLESGHTTKWDTIELCTTPGHLPNLFSPFIDEILI